MSEEWRDIEGSRILKHALNGNGYPIVSLRKFGKQKMPLVHRLVAQAFIPNPENKPHVNHIDHNPINSHVSNLEWVTARENCTHSKLGKGTSLFVGVSFCSTSKKWISMIDFGSKSKRLGFFDNEEEAAKAYIKALESKNIKNKYATL